MKKRCKVDSSLVVGKLAANKHGGHHKELKLHSSKQRYKLVNPKINFPDEQIKI